MFGIKDGKVEGWKTNISLFCLVEKKKKRDDRKCSLSKFTIMSLFQRN